MAALEVNDGDGGDNHDAADDGIDVHGDNDTCNCDDNGCNNDSSSVIYSLVIMLMVLMMMMVVVTMMVLLSLC